MSEVKTRKPEPENKRLQLHNSNDLRYIALSPEQWKVVEFALAYLLDQEEKAQYGGTKFLGLDTRELCRIRHQVSYGYDPNGEGVTESAKRHGFA
jgi:hypothetical protein